MSSKILNISSFGAINSMMVKKFICFWYNNYETKFVFILI